MRSRYSVMLLGIGMIKKCPSARSLSAPLGLEKQRTVME